MVKKSKLTDLERDQIAILLSRGLKVREIGRRLERHHSTIVRETQRNRFGEHYVAIHAQYLSEKENQKRENVILSKTPGYTVMSLKD